MAENCTHLDQIKRVKPKTKGCEECLKMGDGWVHLRLCLSCGHVGCCDSSKNKRKTNTPRNIFTPPNIRLSARRSRAKTGCGVTSMN